MMLIKYEKNTCFSILKLFEVETWGAREEAWESDRDARGRK